MSDGASGIVVVLATQRPDTKTIPLGSDPGAGLVTTVTELGVVTAGWAGGTSLAIGRAAGHAQYRFIAEIARIYTHLSGSCRRGVVERAPAPAPLGHPSGSGGSLPW